MKIKISYNLGRYQKQITPYLKKFNAIANKVLKLDVIQKKLVTNQTYFLDVSFASENEIQKINHTYRHKDNPTDVVSFAFWDEGFISPILGEMYICYQKAVVQAKNYHHSFQREICFLFIHGLLHILGFDHLTPDDEKIMFGIQDLVLEELGIMR